MKRGEVLSVVKNALKMATNHLAGDRDKSVPRYLDPQVERFREVLLEMHNSLESAEAKPVLPKHMGISIADGWSFDSELGKLICEAERLYHSAKCHGSVSGADGGER